MKTGVSRRAGVVVPLFSIRSKRSTGTGEIPDLRYVIDWLNQTGMSILQLLPLNELSYDNSPYNAISTFALEPMYLCLSKLKDTSASQFRKEISDAKKIYSPVNGKTNYGIRNAKMSLLKKIFNSCDLTENRSFEKYISENFHWLKYYCIYKILCSLNPGKSWHDWDLKYKYIIPAIAEKILHEYKHEVKFYSWIQWQLYEQMKSLKRYAKKKQVLLMGDIPFLVSRNSSDVWAYKNYFKLSLSSGAPPDMYFSKGQKWGMPPYNWENIVADNYGYIKRRLKYAENFYDLFRIDHFVGLFRVWTIKLDTSKESGGLIGKFDPEEMHDWEDHAKKIIDVMLESTSMMPCAEDLGTVPEVSGKVLREYGITGINVQRWEKKFSNKIEFIDPEKYRVNSVATVSTHDSSPLTIWFEDEAGTIDKYLFQSLCEKIGIKGEKYKQVLSKLFENDSSEQNRFRWKKNLKGVFEVLNIVNPDKNSAGELINMFLNSFREKEIFLEYIGITNLKKSKADHEFVLKSLEKISASNSVFCINLITEYLFLDIDILKKYSTKDYRINIPGIVSENNWTQTLPVMLEELGNMKINSLLKKINMQAQRK
ncbi:MAG: hypothetical protein HGGPFJEG_00135 [Ignavibacteria bacterium]|nr:hypothetical protein [Ignavibacteria bacterium]